MVAGCTLNKALCMQAPPRQQELLHQAAVLLSLLESLLVAMRVRLSAAGLSDQQRASVEAALQVAGTPASAAVHTACHFLSGLAAHVVAVSSDHLWQDPEIPSLQAGLQAGSILGGQRGAHGQPDRLGLASGLSPRGSSA